MSIILPYIAKLVSIPVKEFCVLLIWSAILGRDVIPFTNGLGTVWGLVLVGFCGNRGNYGGQWFTAVIREGSITVICKYVGERFACFNFLWLRFYRHHFICHIECCCMYNFVYFLCYELHHRHQCSSLWSVNSRWKSCLNNFASSGRSRLILFCVVILTPEIVIFSLQCATFMLGWSFVESRPMEV